MPSDDDSSDDGFDPSGLLDVSRAKAFAGDLSEKLSDDRPKVARMIGEGAATAIAGAIELYASKQVFDVDD